MVKTCSFNMQLLFVFLFFGITYAQEDEAYQELTNLVNQLSAKLDQYISYHKMTLAIMYDQEIRIQDSVGNIDGFQIEIDELRNSLTNQESRIQTNEQDILESKDSLTNHETRIQNIVENSLDTMENNGKIDDFQDDIDVLNTNLTSLDSRIEAIEANIKTNQDNIVETNEAGISSSSVDLEVFFLKHLNMMQTKLSVSSRLCIPTSMILLDLLYLPK